MSDLAVVVPTRGRPEAVAALARAWVDTAATALLVLGVDDDDPCLEAYRAAVDAVTDVISVSLVVGPRLRMIGTLNAIATDLAGVFDAVGFMGDDHRPRTVGWDDTIGEVLAGGGPRIVYGNDLLQGEKMATAVFMTSDVVRTLGYMAPPELTHLCADVVWCDWGRAIERLTYLPDVIVEHMHPANGKGAWDEGYAAVNNEEIYAADAAATADYHASGRFQRDVDILQGLVGGGDSPPQT